MLLPEPVPIPGRPGAVIGGAVTLDPEEVSTRTVRIHDTNVDELAPLRDFIVCFVVQRAQFGYNLGLEGRIDVAPRLNRHVRGQVA